MVSAHWESAPIAVSATRPDVPLLYDFWGFPQKYYEVTYAAPGAPALAGRVAGLLGDIEGGVHQDPTRGLDHGAYVPLVEMYPQADIPVLQLSLPTLDPQRLFEVGQRLAPLRDEGVMVIGSSECPPAISTPFLTGSGAHRPPGKRTPAQNTGRRSS